MGGHASGQDTGLTAPQAQRPALKSGGPFGCRTLRKDFPTKAKAIEFIKANQEQQPTTNL